MAVEFVWVAVREKGERSEPFKISTNKQPQKRRELISKNTADFQKMNS